ncbi:hypothetical protein KY290_012732 [Solanum tuberosum]|uniref:Retroviral polymerase SH3-like domain-containing protein n=1 Tax=Solanum tuberosum TaxID=4113 RepID=A0ABQ7VL29_SOLTU|nr:hypothetical protein KY285_012605 [Solanum tuberosum]KAH0768751.1 hypothetical protein KY290_012732 [Solanum tuberosum]
MSERGTSSLAKKNLLAGVKKAEAEELKIIAYVINLSPVAFDGDVPNRVWFAKDVSYGHLKVFGCKACVHVPKDERSKLDIKTKQCIFIGYGQDEFRYQFYDPVDKKLIRSRDVVFFEDQTIEDIDKVEKPDSQIDESLIDVDPVPIIDTSFAYEGTQDNDADNDQGVEPIDFPIDDVVVDHQPICLEIITSDAPETSCRRSTREKRSSTRYSPNEYILLIDMREPESYDKVMLDTHKDRW